MDERAVIERLGVLQAPRREESRRRAIESVPARLPSPPARGAGGSPRLSPRLVVAVAALLLALVAAARYTEPGQAFTSWVGDQLGFGHPGEHPSLQRLRHFATRESSAAGQPAYVLVRGRAPHGGHYEFVGYRARTEADKEWPSGAPCFELELPEAHNLSTAGCGVPSARQPVRLGGFAGNSDPGGEFIDVTGRIGAAVASVEVGTDGRQAPVTVSKAPAAVLSRLGIDRPFRIFVAFPPFPAHGGTVTLRLRDRRGRVITQRHFFVPDPRPMRRRACAMAQKLAGEGKLKQKVVRADCRGT